MLRHSPRLTLASLAARRANALKSTGPRTDRGKAWSCLNALRHGRRARNFRARLERIRDRQSIFLFDYIFANLMKRWKPGTEWEWNLTAREAVRAWCFLTGRMLLPRLKGNGQRMAIEGCPTYRYGERRVCPTHLKITNKNGIAIRFRNPTPSRRKHVKNSWLPRAEFFDPPPRLPRAKRVRRTDHGATELADALARVFATGAPAGSSLAPPSGRGNGVGKTEIHSRTNLECGLESAACLETSAGGRSLATKQLSLATAVKGVLARVREVLRL